MGVSGSPDLLLNYCKPEPFLPKTRRLPEPKASPLDAGLGCTQRDDLVMALGKALLVEFPYVPREPDRGLRDPGLLPFVLRY